MKEEIKLRTRDWERLLSYTQQQKYRNAIKQGYFSTYHGASWRHDTFYGAYIWKYPRYINVVRLFEKVVGHRPLWKDVTDDNLRDLYDELQGSYAPNSVRTICATVKAVIRENDPTRDIPSPTFGKILKARQVPVQAVYLTDNEIDRIIHYHPQGACRRYVHRMFVMECLCGARLSDCKRMSTENIDETGRFLVYVTKKTKTEVRVPIHKKLRPFLVCGTGDAPAGGVSPTQFGRIVREICMECDIDSLVKVFQKGREMSGRKWEFVTSHTGRRSFATNLSKKGISIEQIAVMMGHTTAGKPNIMMTQRYIVGKTEINSDTLRVFGVYDDDYLGASDEELDADN